MSQPGTTTRPPIAVVGVSALFPGSSDVTGFWRDILAGTDRMTPVPPTHWLVDDYFDADPAAIDKTYGRRGGFLDPVDLDPIAFGVPPSVVPATDTAQLLALIVAQQVLDDAVRGQFTELDRSRVSVILGVTSGQELLGAMASRMNRPMWLQGMRRAGVPEDVAQRACAQIADLHPAWAESTFPGLLGNVVAGRVANRLNLGGTNCVTDAACASSFSAISMGINELYLGDSDLVISGGVDTMNDILMYMCFSKTPALSRTEDIRPFSDQADGTMLGEGIGMVALKRLADAERDGNRIYCVINGVGASSDGRAKSVYAPVPAGQARAIEAAYAKAGYGADTVELVEAHGTGTVAGDAAEFAGLETVFNATGRADRQWCALGTVKSQIGHTKAAAGAAGLIKTIMALQHRVLPPTAKVQRPNPKLDLGASPFHLTTRALPWVRDSAHPRRGSVSSFGFGGSNFHIALSEYTGSGNRAPRRRTSDVELLVFSGADAAAIAAELEQVRQGLENADGPADLARLAWDSQRRFDSGAASRLSVLATVTAGAADLRAKLDQAIGLLRRSPAAAFQTPTGIAYGTGAPAGELAFLFPGQGSQYPFMGADLAMQFGAAIAAWDAAADACDGPEPLPGLVFPVRTFADDEPVAQRERLTATQWAQPAIAATSLSMLRVLDAIGVRADHVAGHSFGEITALHAAGALSAADAVRVARRRGELMAQAAQIPGAMTAVVAGLDQLRELVDASADVVIANHNSPTQVVLSGPTSAIERVEGELGRLGLTFRRLPVATAFHSSVVDGAGAAFTEYLATVDVRPPVAVVHANETAAPYPTEADAVRAQLGRQLTRPVRFVELIEGMYARGVRTFLEVGPSSVLTGLVDAILGERDHRAIALDNRTKGGLGAFLGGLGQLAAAGVAIDFAPLWAEYGSPADEPAAVKPGFTIPINGANYGKPYPGDLAELVGPNPDSGSVPVTPPAPPSVPVAPVPVAPVPVAPAPPPAVPAAAMPAAPPRSEPVVSATPPAVPSPLPSAPPSPAGGPSDEVLAVYQAVQLQTAQAHTAYLNTVAQAHGAFLQTAQQSLAAVGWLAGAETGPLPAAPVAAGVAAVAPAPVIAVPAVPAPPAPIAAPSAPVLAPSAPVPPPAPVVAVPPPTPPAPSAPTAAPAPATSEEATDAGPSLAEVTSALVAVVAEKTGYPAEMLSLEMELESDLGIDSIKRVQILSAMQDRMPQLPVVDASAMARLLTLRQIVDHLAEELGEPAVPVAPGPVEVVAGAGPSLAEVTSALVAVVAEKTGYPAEMLSLEMELESDLGIDSIKRVQILSAMQDRMPQLPVVDASAMARLLTLRQIVDHLAEELGEPVAQAVSAEPARIDQGPGPELGRLVTEAVESSGSGAGALAGLGGRVAVTDDGGGVGAALVDVLTGHGLDAELVGELTGNGYAGVVFLGGLRELTDVTDAAAVNTEAFRAARAAGSTSKSFVIVSDLGGSFGRDDLDPTRAWTSGLTGLVRTAALEWPATRVQAIDIQRAARGPQDVARAIGDELLRGGQEIEVGIRADGTRLTLSSVPARVDGGAMPLGADDVIVASGGGRGVTAATMVELARATRARFVLLGRSPLDPEPAVCAGAADDVALKRALLDDATAHGRTVTPAELGRQVRAILANREIRQTLEQIEAAGGQVRYLAVDVTDADAVAQALQRVRQEVGPITGVVHGAGVLADRRIVDKTDAQFDTVFRTKVQGLRSLLAATAADELRLLCVFSSVAARTGNEGQADYAMANEVLNKVAVAERTRRGPGCIVKSFAWGPWSGGMVDDALAQRFRSMGVALLPLDVGAAMFVAEIASPQVDQVEVMIGSATLGAPAAASRGA